MFFLKIIFKKMVYELNKVILALHLQVLNNGNQHNNDNEHNYY